MKTVIGVVVLAAIAGGVYLLNDLTRDREGKSLLHVAQTPEIPVETATPELREIVRTVQAPGEVEAFEEVDISSEVMGKIVEMPVEEGDLVEAGDLLCRLDDADYRARVLSGEANVAKLKALIVQADADLEKAERDFEQQKRLIETDATSPLEMANYRTLLVGARANLETRKHELVAAEAALASAKEDLARTVMVAPIDGVVAQRFAEVGEVVITGTMNNPGTRIMVVSDLSKMQVRCRVDEADAPLVAPGQVARIYLQSDTHRSIAGEVLRVGTKGTKQLGRDVVTFETLVLITGVDPRVKPGMTANVEIEVARKSQTLTVPVEAVVYRRQRDLPAALVEEYHRRRAERDPEFEQNVAEYLQVVFCVVDGRAQPRLIEAGINDTVRVEVTTGLAVEDTIVTGPYRSLDQLRADMVVKPVVRPATLAPASQPAAGDAESEDAPASAPAAEEPK